MNNKTIIDLQINLAQFIKELETEKTEGSLHGKKMDLAMAKDLLSITYYYDGYSKNQK